MRLIVNMELVKHPYRLCIYLICLIIFLPHYNPLHLHTVLASVAPSSERNDNKLVVLNFDDTDLTQISYVKPILDKYGFNATFFPICGQIRYAPGLDAIRNLQLGGYDIQSHTMTHPNLNTLSAEQLDSEIGLSKQCLLNLGINATVFAYPYGEGLENATVVSTVAKYYDLARGATYCCSDKMTSAFEDRYSINSWVPVHIDGYYDYKNLTCGDGDCQYYNNSRLFKEFVKVVNEPNKYNEDGSIRIIPIIVFHKIVPYGNIEQSKIPTDTSVNLFNLEMKYLHDNGFEVLSMADLRYDENNKSLYKRIP